MSHQTNAIEPSDPDQVELALTRQRIAELEAANRELLAVADNSALNLAMGRIAELEAAARFARSVIKAQGMFDLSERMAYSKLSVALSLNGADLPQGHPTDPDLEQFAAALLAKSWPLLDPAGREAIRREVQDFMLSRLCLAVFFHIGQVEATYPHLHQFLQSTAQEEVRDA